MPTTNPVRTDLVAGAAAAVIFDNDTLGRFISFDIAVSIAALTGLEVWGKASPQGAWQPIATQAADFTSPTGLAMSVVSNGTPPGTSDATITPAGYVATIGLRLDYWRRIQLRAKSAGAAHVDVTWSQS